MRLFEKNRRGIYVYFKNFKDMKKIEKYGNFISYSRRGKYVCLYLDENQMESIVQELSEKRYVKKIEISELMDFDLELK